jgi:threonine/homoserine/homoserine lactone efflux protein
MEELEALYHGVLLGFVLFVSAGPIFFAVIETSIRKGFRYALSISVGTFFSDVLYIALAYFGLQPLFQNETFKVWLGIIGGIVLISFGIIQLLKKPDLHAKDLHLKKQSSYAAYALKGFVINTFNPFVFFFWLAVIGGVTVNYEDSNTSQLMFFTGVLGTILLTDMIKAFVAEKIKHLLNPTLFLWVNRLVGVVMIYFGLRMIWKVAVSI